jgi:hypothetical protein
MMAWELPAPPSKLVMIPAEWNTPANPAEITLVK